MAENAAGDELPPPDGAYSPDDDELDELVGGATRDLVDDQALEDVAEPTTATSESESTQGNEPSTETGEGAEGTDDEGAEGAPAPVAPAAPARAEGKEKPFTFKASGAEHQFQGVSELADGSLRVSKEATPQFRTVLASYVELQRTSKEERRNLQRQLNAATKQRSDKDLEADQISTLFKDLQKMTPEERWIWAEEYAEKAPRLAMEIRQQAIDRREKAIEAREKGEPDLLPEEQQERFGQTLNQEIYATFTRLLATPQAKLLPDAERQKLWQRWQQKGARLVTRATADDPVTGIKKGQLVFDDSDIVDDFLDRVSLYERTQGTLTAAQKNAKMNADQGRKQPPPTVRGGKPPAQGGKKGKPDLRGKKQEFKKAFIAGQLDASDD